MAHGLADKPAGVNWADRKRAIQARIPGSALRCYRFFRTGDYRAALAFLAARREALSFGQRLSLVRRMLRAHARVTCEHTQGEMLAVMRAVFAMPRSLTGCMVEAGCFKGGSTSKLSIAARLTGRKLFVFDSFQGIPENTEDHGKNIWGGAVGFAKGDYCGTLDEVRENVTRYGEISACEFVQGFFEDSMPGFREPVVAAYVDVDLASSTRTCLKYLYPLLVPGGYLFSQDGHLPLVLQVLQDDTFWREELGCPRPQMHGIGTQKLVWLQKPAEHPQRYQALSNPSALPGCAAKR